jgi:DUF438 domain-containing protein
MSELINNREHRVATLKQIVLDLHAGADMASVKHRMKELVGQCDAGEIAAMEQQLMADGIQVHQIMGMCDLHREAVSEVLAPDRTPLPPGHPADVLHQENAALTVHVQELRRLLTAAAAPGADPAMQFGLRQAFNLLMDLDKHYQRKEHCFFSMLERHGIDGPSKVMWAKDDEVRAALKEFAAALALDGGWDRIAPAGMRACELVEAMVRREEDILIPMCLSVFTADDWVRIHADSPEYGWCLVEPRRGWQPAATAPGPGGAALPAGAGIDLATGVLTAQQLITLFRHLPVDITFVDHEDRVRFFSEGPNRVFARTPIIIGRLVQHCHPPKSVDIVERILHDFRGGRQSKAEFWIDFKNRFVHIQYFAMRGADGTYLGCLEVTQDASHVRALTGERRLLAYD